MSNSVHYYHGMSMPFDTPKNNGQYNVSFVFDRDGNRKYATLKERRKFLRIAKATAPLPVYTFCLVLTLTGARISEALSLTPRQIDLGGGVIVLRSLKKRNLETPTYRAVPIPTILLRELDTTHAIAAAQRNSSRLGTPIWPWCRTTGWKRVKEVMEVAGIRGPQASPKGLRHGFAVGALVAGVPDITVMRWLGHARLETTMIYTEAIGAEAEAIAKRMWKPLLRSDLLA